MKPKKKKRTGLLKAAVLILAVLSFLLVILYLPVWRVKEVIVQGNKIVAREQIIEQAGISFDENIFFVNSGEVRRSIKEIPQIKKTDVFAKIPSSIVIRVEERKPFAVFIVDGSYYIADNEGVILNREQGVKGALDLPTVVGLSKGQLVSENRIAPSLVEALAKSYKLLSQLMPPNSFAVEMKQAADINILINDIIKVKIGEPLDIDKKLFVLRLLFERAGDKRSRIEYVDVRLPDLPVVKFR